LYFWGNNSTHYKFSDPNSKSGTHGFGISADQAVNNYLGLFARVGYKNHAVEFKNSNNTFALPLSLIWSVGAQIKGYKWLRENDTVGIAVGQIHGSSDAKGVIREYNNGNYKDTAETQLEVYYKLTLNSYIALTPALQYVANPRGGNVLTNAKNANNNVFVYGIRTSFNF
jgi:carbohydrate-selective porin OprB